MTRYIDSLRVVNTQAGKRYYTTVIPVDPKQERIQYEYKARIGDRWDTIAFKYLGNAALWYVVANANNALNGSIFIKPGTIIKIPEV
jgi:nucleoid-associated protein YgaU